MKKIVKFHGYDLELTSCESISGSFCCDCYLKIGKLSAKGRDHYFSSFGSGQSLEAAETSALKSLTQSIFFIAKGNEVNYQQEVIKEQIKKLAQLEETQKICQYVLSREEEEVV